MAKTNLSRMDVASLIDLRKQVEDALLSQRAKLEKQLEVWGVQSPRWEAETLLAADA
jgi:hypothetical protein